ncbi:hypothetical protein C4D60_Mb01t30390 [Musa balbisiana]|uniref:t-SNARE coiled-coil homology domain-containing protein n=1 Tax=Musa balbisiana TaxID=52838 RepID=A0A4S8JRU7_MUSBA|nr:hypothetical protein C4D60_Mb01t30390 [Musa balbisiana]
MNPKPERSSSSPVIGKKNPVGSSSSYDEDEGREALSYSHLTSAAARNRYKNDFFHDAGGLENQSVQELENYAAYKAEETTQKVNDCLKIAKVTREDASDTLVMLHQQGEQITRTHEITVSIDHDLSRKILMG